MINETTIAMVQKRAACNEDFEPIFIVGHNRSGTTLLATILDRHSQVAIPPIETGLFLRAFRHRRKNAIREGSHSAWLEYLRTMPHAIKCMDEVVAPLFLEGPATLADLFRCLLEVNAVRCGRSRCGEKSPMHLLAVPELLKAYPRARIVCLMRDGRDVVRSCLRTPIYTWEPAWWHCMSWCQCAALTARYQREHPGRFLICRFEKLVENPADEVKRIDEFLDISFEPWQIEGVGSMWSEVEKVWFMKKAADPPDRKRANSWKQFCDVREARYLTGLMNPWLARFGYDTFTSPIVAGPRWLYPGYRALAFLLRVPRMSNRLTGTVVRAWRRLGTRLTYGQQTPSESAGVRTEL